MDWKVYRMARVIRSMPKKSYLSYIFSQQWAATRRQHLERTGHICEICKSRRAFQVHHWTYARLGCEHPADLCAVCVQCHHGIHCSVFEPANDNEPELPFELPEIKKSN